MPKRLPPGPPPPAVLPSVAQVRRARLISRRLSLEYPAHCELVHASPLQLLIATILSAQSTDARVNQVTPLLFARFPDALALARADPAEVEQLIHATGFFRAKTRSILACCQELVERFGGQVPPRMEDLVSLPGVGRKTANVVLGVGFGIPGLPVDTHVIRLSARLGLSAAGDPEGIESDLCAMVPRRDWTGLSLRLILHGRRVCLARSPRCMLCLLNDVCPSSTVPGRPSRRPSGDDCGGSEANFKPAARRNQ